MFAGKVRAGFVPHLRREVLKALKPHHADECPFLDLPNPKSSRWGSGVTADEMREIPEAARCQERARGAAGSEREHLLTV